MRHIKLLAVVIATLVVLVIGANLATAQGIEPTSPRPYRLGQTNIPFIIWGGSSSSQYSVADDGSHHASLTNLTVAYATFPYAYLYIGSGVLPGGTAGFYFAECSSTSACTVYNNLYPGYGTPAIPGSPAAFGSTVTGANVTQSTSEITAYTLPMAPNTMAGINACLDYELVEQRSGTANLDTVNIYIDSTQIQNIGISATAGTYLRITEYLCNEGSNQNQVTVPGNVSPYGLGNQLEAQKTFNMTAKHTLGFTLTLGAPSDYIVLSRVKIDLNPGVL